ncbi:MAG: hypothetical protein ACREC0_00775 [Methylocella sp.]
MLASVRAKPQEIALLVRGTAGGSNTYGLPPTEMYGTRLIALPPVRAMADHELAAFQ